MVIPPCHRSRTNNLENLEKRVKVRPKYIEIEMESTANGIYSGVTHNNESASAVDTHRENLLPHYFHLQPCLDPQLDLAALDFGDVPFDL